jgi:uncharacterized protein
MRERSLRSLGRGEFILLTVSILCFVVPAILVVMAGITWLELHGWLWWWLGLCVCCYVAGWRGIARITRPRPRREVHDDGVIETERFWAEGDLAVWRRVTALSGTVERGERSMSSLADARALADELLDMIAPSYFPASTDPRLEVRVADLLYAIEETSRDLRTSYLAHVPLHNLLTVNEALHVRRSWGKLQGWYDIYRVLRPWANPVSALLHEVRAVFARGAISAASEHTLSWTHARLVEVAGKHLINLYAGYTVAGFREHPRSREALAPSVDTSRVTVAVIGEVNAGKSTLINSLFGEMRSVTSHLPETKGVLRFEKYNDDGSSLVVLDTAGFGEGPFEAWTKMLERQMREVDVIVLVTPAHTASRSQDRAALDTVAERYGRDVPVVVAVSKVDLLRPFNEWSPPYNLEDPSTHQEEARRRKAEHIKACVHDVSRDLGVDVTSVIPVMMREGSEVYNVDALSLVLQERLPQARMQLLRRLLREYRDDQYWNELRDAVWRGGRLLARVGVQQAVRGLTRLSDLGRRGG